MKKIIILSAFLSPMRSGAEACAEEVPLALSDQFDFTIVTARMRRNLPKRDMLNGKIPIVRVGVGVSVIDKWLYPFLAPIVVARIKPDVVHAILETFAGLALVLCRAPKKILTCQTTNRSFLKGWIVRSADQVTAISTALVDIVQPYREDTVIKIPNGIDVRVFEEARKRVEKVSGRILFVGRLERQKGVDTLLAALVKLKIQNCYRRQSLWEKLKIVGDGSQRIVLKQLAQKLGIADRVEFLGYIPADKIAEEYTAAEIFCGLSRSEALGNVFLEAQAAGCAVIATSVGGIPDIIEQGRTGILVSPDDPQSAADAISKLFLDDKLREQLSACGTKNAQRYDWNDIAAKYAKLY